jgi:hypothetical protein
LNIEEDDNDNEGIGKSFPSGLIGIHTDEDIVSYLKEKE